MLCVLVAILLSGCDLLTGPPGPAGADGIDGTDGATGPQGGTGAAGYLFICEGGTPEIALSSQPDITRCVECDRGYVLENQACRPAMYYCDHGDPITGTPPGNSDEHVCDTCDSGYMIDNETNQCVQYPYVCSNGLPKIGTTTTPNENRCRSCDEGYYLSFDSFACIANT